VTLVVPWVVDDEPVMWDLLAHKDVDAVISNRPVQLLRALRSAHSQLC
jgi:glycerophosphoryl diester phosphodiesterase